MKLLFDLANDICREPMPSPQPLSLDELASETLPVVKRRWWEGGYMEATRHAAVRIRQLANEIKHGRVVVEYMGNTSTAPDPHPSPTAFVSEQFIAFYNHIAQACHQNSRAHGFWDQEKETADLAQEIRSLQASPVTEQLLARSAEVLERLGKRNQAEQIALMHSELSELLEGLRGGNKESDHIPGFTFAEEECADTLIRIMDFAVGEKLRVAEALVAKMKFNEGRPIKQWEEVLR